MFISDVTTDSYHNRISGLTTPPLNWQWISTYIPLFYADILTHPYPLPIADLAGLLINEIHVINRHSTDCNVIQPFLVSIFGFDDQYTVSLSYNC